MSGQTSSGQAGGGVSGGGAGPSQGGFAQGGFSGSPIQAGAASVEEPADALAPWPSPGCGQEPQQALGEFVRYAVPTSGTKGADAIGTPGAWSYEREYFVELPQQYLPSKAYPLVIEAPGCAGSGTDVYRLKVEGGVIRVGLTPPPDANGQPSCFDVKEGDDSVEWPFYEQVMEQLSARFCYDQHQVWAAGSSSGGFLVNELACRYASVPGYSIRGVVALGGLPTSPASVPTCSRGRVAGMWIGDANDLSHPLAEVTTAVSRVMDLNGCTGGIDYDHWPYDDFPISTHPGSMICRQLMGCAAGYPVVFCPIPGFGRTSHEDIVVPGFAKLVEMLAAP